MEEWASWAERQSWGRDGGSFTGGPPKGVIHTTETRGWPNYQNGAVAPTLTAMPLPMDKRLIWRQHSPLNVAARALRNESGGVQTNRDSVVQIELVGTCDPDYATRYPDAFKWYDAPGWALQQLAEKVKWLSQNNGIELVSVAKPWLVYPKSYGSKNGQRLTLSEWDNFSGWCGHMHVAENTHGDPGSLDMALVMQYAGGQLALPTTPIKPPVVSGTKAPAFPLPAGHYFGPRQGEDRSHSGYFSARDRQYFRMWQAQMRKRGWRGSDPLDVDGLYGNESRSVAVDFQKQVFGHSDGLMRFGAKNGAPPWSAEFGLVGPGTWRAAWEAPIT